MTKTLSLTRSITPILIHLLLLTSTTPNPKQIQIDSFNLLLPTSYHPVKGHARQLVITSGGCYEWQSSEGKVVGVRGTHQGGPDSEGGGCTANGIIELLWEGRYGGSVYVTARDRESSDVMTIPVRVRDLNRIAIFTKSKIMNIKQIQNLQIYGFDQEQNTFTSLQGLRFKWTITQISNGRAYEDSLEKIPLKDSSLYQALDTRLRLEMEGVESDMIVVRGNSVGKVSVKVRCLQPNYELITDQITLYIQQKFQISPPQPLSLLPGSHHRYSLLTPSQARIPLPSPYYTITSSNPAFIVDQTLTVHAPKSNQDSSTRITISDRRTEPPFTQSVEVLVRVADRMEIVGVEGVVIGEKVGYGVRFYREGKLLAGELSPGAIDARIVDQVGVNGDRTDIIKIDPLSQTLQATQKGTATLRISYNGLTQQKLLITTTPLKLLSAPIDRKITLPINELYQLTVIGGSGSYKYTYNPSSQDQSILSLSFNGLITTRREGVAEIGVFDQRNGNNRIVVRVQVVRIGDLYSLEEYKEFNIGSDGSLYLGATPRGSSLNKAQYYTQCNDALLRGLSFTPIASTQTNPPNPLKLINTNPVSYQTLRELESQSQNNPFLKRLLKKRSSIGLYFGSLSGKEQDEAREQFIRQYADYLKYGEIKRSQLERVLIDMESYGLCAKVLVKAVDTFDGVIQITKQHQKDKQRQKQTTHRPETKMKLRVYQKLQNKIPKLHTINKNLNTTKDQIFLTPQTSFRWLTTGGPYSWRSGPNGGSQLGELEVVVNDGKIDKVVSRAGGSSYPIISCGNVEKSNTLYVLKYRNPTSMYLLRPVQQQTEIIVECRTPETMRIGTPARRQSSTQPTDQHIHIPKNSKNQQNLLDAQLRDLINKIMQESSSGSDYLTDVSSNTGNNQFDYFLSGNKQQNTTVYILPGQSFKISVLPVLLPFSDNSVVGASVDQRYIQFYNATNINVEIEGVKYGQIQPILRPRNYIQTQTPTEWNTYTFQYHSKNRRSTDTQKQDSIHITINQFLNPRTRQPYRLQTPLKHTIHIKTVQPIKLTNPVPLTLDLPNLPQNTYTLTLTNAQSLDPSRLSLRYDPSLLKATKTQKNQIILSTRPTDKPISTELVIVDEHAIGGPEIVVPVRVQVVAGVDLRVGRDRRHVVELQGVGAGVDRFRAGFEVDRSGLESDTWVFDGEEFVVYVDVYSYNASAYATSAKQPIQNLDPSTIDITFEKSTPNPPKQLSRKHDSKNNLIMILYKLPRVFPRDMYKDKPQGSASALNPNTKQLLKLTASVKGGNMQINSNPATVQIYKQISVVGLSSVLGVEELDVDLRGRDRDRGNGFGIVRRVDSYAYILEGCETVLQIIGGPTLLKTRILSNPGQGRYYNIIKLSHHKYKIQTIQSTPATTSATAQQPIQGDQPNLLTILVQIPLSISSTTMEQLTRIHCLVQVAPITSVRVVGNGYLLAGVGATEGTEGVGVRYLVQFGDKGDYGGNKIIKEECKFVYKWSITGGDLVTITSNTQKSGVNISTSTQAYTSQQLTQNISKQQPHSLQVVVSNKLNRQIGRASKYITVVGEERSNVLGISGGGEIYGGGRHGLVYGEQVLLVPSRSGLQFGLNVVLEELSDCGRQDGHISIGTQPNQILTGQPSPNPQLLKLHIRAPTTSTSLPSSTLILPIFLTVQVTQICTVAIQNTDGSIALNPSQGSSFNSGNGMNEREGLQLIKFYVMDCLGRKFLHYDYKDVEYRVSSTNRGVVSGSVYDVGEGLIRVEGHEIGDAKLILQVIHKGIIKARDIVPIQVNIFLRPAKPVTVHIGDLINFKGPSTPSPNLQRWSTSDDSILKINSRTGQAVAFAEGQTQVRYGAMSVRVRVVRVSDLVRRDSRAVSDEIEGFGGNGYVYEIVYSGNMITSHQDRQHIKQQLNWQCQILSKQSKSLRCKTQKHRSPSSSPSQPQKQYLSCQIEKIPGSPTISTPITKLRLKITAHNSNNGFRYQKQFLQDLEMFVVLSEKIVNPRDPAYARAKNYQVIIQTGERLDVYQTGGQDRWIIGNQFNGARQVVTIDISQYKGSQYKLNIANTRTRQTDTVIFTHDPKRYLQLAEQKAAQDSDRSKDSVPSDGWKWTDILVIFMAVNFLAIVAYQFVYGGNGAGHSKIY